MLTKKENALAEILDDLCEYLQSWSLYALETEKKANNIQNVSLNILNHYDIKLKQQNNNIDLDSERLYNKNIIIRHLYIRCSNEIRKTQYQFNKIIKSQQEIRSTLIFWQNELIKVNKRISSAELKREEVMKIHDQIGRDLRIAEFNLSNYEMNLNKIITESDKKSKNNNSTDTESIEKKKVLFKTAKKILIQQKNKLEKNSIELLKMKVEVENAKNCLIHCLKSLSFSKKAQKLINESSRKINSAKVYAEKCLSICNTAQNIQKEIDIKNKDIVQKYRQSLKVYNKSNALLHIHKRCFTSTQLVNQKALNFSFGAIDEIELISERLSKH